MASITKAVVNFFWFFFKLGLAIALVAGVVAFTYFYRRMDEELRRGVEARIAAQYPHLKVQVRYAQLVEGKGIEIRGLSITDPNATGPRAELAFLDEVFLTCTTNLQDLISGKLEVSEIHVQRPIIRATREADGSYSTARLLPLPRFGEKPPEATIENAVLEICDPLKNPVSTLTWRDIHLSTKPVIVEQPAGDRAADRTIDVVGHMAADQVQRIEFAGRVNLDRALWSLGGSVAGLEISPELRDTLPTPIAAKLTILGTLRGDGAIKFHVSHNPDRPQPFEFDVDALLTRGRIDDARLPYPLTDLKGRLRCDNQGFAVDDLTGRSGRTAVRASCRRRGYESHSPLHLEAVGTHVVLDEPLAAVLPQSLHDCWYKYLPEGEIDANIKLDYDGKTWKPEVAITCLNVSFAYHKFPYRLEHGVGTIVMRNNVLTTHLTVYTAGQPVELKGEVKNPGPDFTGFMNIKGVNVQFDEKLFVALSKKAGDVVRSLNPHGTFNIYCQYWRDDSQRPDIHQQVVVELNRCSINFEKFPYPMSNVRGRLEMTDGQWTFHDLEGTNDTGVITCKGNMAREQDGGQLTLHFTGKEVPLEKELRDALRPDMQRLWNSLNPHGSFDMPSCDVRYWPDTKKMNLEFTGQPRSETTMEPTFFPYRMEKLNGTLYYRDGHADLKDVQAYHGRTKFMGQGQCDFEPEGGWRLQLKNISVDHLRTDHELVAALPDGLKKAVAELKPTGSMLLNGNLSFAKGPQTGAAVQSQWDLIFNLQQASLNCGIKLENLCGGVRLWGRSNGSQFSSNGELSLDSITFKNFQFTEVLGPFYLDNQRADFGARAERPQPGKLPRRVTSTLFGGKLLADCSVIFGSPVQYFVQADLANADLERYAKENLSGRQKLNGKVIAHTEFKGTDKGPHTLDGIGNVHLREANIYELPVMVSLLNLLSFRPPDSNAFSTSDIDFRLQGEHMLLDKIVFGGDAITLKGKGWLNMDKQVNLTFYAMVGRERFYMPVLTHALGQASQQIMQIHVEGATDHPVVRKEALPAVGRALQELQAEMQRSWEQSTPPQGAVQRPTQQR